MSKIVCFGELMLRLNPEGYLRFEQADKFMATFGGGEANVAVSLANFGMDASFCSKLPTHAIGNMAVRALRAEGVATADIVRGGERVGIYYIEKGASQRPSKVIYDRKYSAIGMASREDFDWDKILCDTVWFHFTGITPALGDNVAEICLDAVKACRAKGIKISCDLNFRKNLWTSEKAGKVMGELMQYVNVCIANEEDADKVFGIKPASSIARVTLMSQRSFPSVSAAKKWLSLCVRASPQMITTGRLCSMTEKRHISPKNMPCI